MRLEIAFLLGIAVYLVVSWSLVDRLSKLHRRGWKEAGSPPTTLWMPIANQVRFLRFMFGLKSFRLEDYLLKVLSVVFFALYFFLISSFLVILARI